MKRAIATFTVFVYGEDDQVLFNEAKRLERILLDADDNRANLHSLTNAPFGSIDPDDHTEIDISSMELLKEF